MITVKKENVIYKIEELEKKDYLRKGFVVIDETGNTVESANKNQVSLEQLNDLEKQVKNLIEKVETLTDENKSLTSEKNKLEKQVKDLNKKSEKKSPTPESEEKKSPTPESEEEKTE